MSAPTRLTDEIIPRIVTLQIITRAYENELGGSIDALVTREFAEKVMPLVDEIDGMSRTDADKRETLEAMFRKVSAELLELAEGGAL